MDRRRPKGRKMGSSRRLMLKQEEAAGLEAEASPENEEDSVFNEMTEKIQQLLSNDGTNINLFIRREDMEISGAIFCTVEDLEELFDELSKGGKAQLTFEEFTSGLKKLINSSGNQWNQTRKRKSTKRITEFPRFLSLEEADTEERQQFKSFMEQLGAHNVLEDETEIWKLWTRLGQEEPHLLENLEEFLAKIVNQIKDAKKEKETLEMMLKKRITEHNVEVQRLYEEMEQQMREEIKRLTKESNTRSSIHDHEMKNAIELKNTEVQQLISVQNELEKELYNLRSMEHVTKSENEKLKRTNQDLELDLEKIRDQLSEAQGCLGEMQEKMAQHEYEKEIKENEELMNISSAQFYQIFFQDTTQKAKNNEQESEQGDSQESIDLEQQNTFENIKNVKSSRSRVISIEEDPIQECLLKHPKLRPEGIAEEMPTKDFFGTTEAGYAVPLSGTNSPTIDGYIEKEHSSITFQINKATYRDVKKIDIASEIRRNQQDIDFEIKNTDQFFNLHENIEKENVSAEERSKIPNQLEEFHADPDHVYKIMFVGNTHVGKTSFLHHIHDGSYQQSTSATIGIDYRIKSLIVDSKHYALQLWDTAGQERFYSLTEQFFRKADGMVIMYDVTSRDTFTGVRRWLNCIQEKVIDDIIILLLGNKIDCDAERQVSFDDGQKLAQEYKLLFSECSAASGINITESLIQIVRSLKENEDNMKNNVVTLKRSASLKKTSCCT
ncbi:EF-hand calcium-binding domain-containing protein 4B-like isoform X2 [Eleutherodactylus coqui]|uniref:EF-hand calcium-binding domain-containing protein 4B-like isoform X2 n=1 Tax=Eleutherodactylus coqui TaxID=57060 RepID=UPI003462160C